MFNYLSLCVLIVALPYNFPLHSLLLLLHFMFCSWMGCCWCCRCFCCHARAINVVQRTTNKYVNHSHNSMYLLHYLQPHRLNGISKTKAARHRIRFYWMNHKIYHEWSCIAIELFVFNSIQLFSYLIHNISHHLSLCSPKPKLWSVLVFDFRY